MELKRFNNVVIDVHFRNIALKTQPGYYTRILNGYIEKRLKFTDLSYNNVHIHVHVYNVYKVQSIVISRYLFNF